MSTKTKKIPLVDRAEKLSLLERAELKIALSKQSTLTIDEAALMLSIGLPTLRLYRGLHRGPRFTKLGRRLITTPEECQRWYESKEEKSCNG